MADDIEKVDRARDFLVCAAARRFGAAGESAGKRPLSLRVPHQAASLSERGASLIQKAARRKSREHVVRRHLLPDFTWIWYEVLRANREDGGVAPAVAEHLGVWDIRIPRSSPIILCLTEHWMWKTTTMASMRNITFDLVRVIGIFFVMLMHSPVVADVTSTPEIFFLKKFIAGGAVPSFFFLSGYLGAGKMASSSISARAYFQGKLRTLVIPFLFWNTLVLLLVFCMKYAGMDSALQGGGAYFQVELSVSAIAAALFGIGRTPIVYQFWFLRDLIVVVPVAFILCRYAPRIPFLPWLLFFIPVPMASSLAYYLLGYQMHSSFPSMKLPDWKSSVGYCTCWLLMGVGIALEIVHVPYPLWQMGNAAFIWMLASIASACPFPARLASFGPAVFFIYATHEPLQTLMGRLWQRLNIPAYDTLFCFLVVPMVAFLLCLLAYRLFQRIAPGVLAFATGGRSANKMLYSTGAGP